MLRVACCVGGLRRYFLVILMVLTCLILGLTATCIRGAEFDFEQQQIFEARFQKGMSREEVESQLALFGEYTLIDYWVFPNGDLRLEYYTETRNWGSPTYYFRFSPDNELISLFPISD